MSQSEAVDYWFYETRQKWICCPQPMKGPFMATHTAFYILLPICILSFAYMCCMIVWAPIATVNNSNCHDDLEGYESQLSTLKKELHDINQATDHCYDICNQITCSDCCPACPWTAAPPAPTENTLWRYRPINNTQCPNSAYGAIVSPIPTSLCRLGSVKIFFCGFMQDYSISLLESPHSPPAGYGNGTIIASRLVQTIVNNVFCISALDSYGPTGVSTFTLRGDQTGYAVSIDVNIHALASGTGCSPIVCPYLVV